jgi:hypothetical protein
MPAPKTNFIPYSCFGYYDETFIECSKKCKYADSCKNATESDEKEEVRKIFKFTNKQI